MADFNTLFQQEVKNPSKKSGGRPDFNTLFALRDDPNKVNAILSAQSKADSENDKRRKQAINTGLNRGLSWEDISKQTGVDVNQIKQLSESTRPGYGIKPSNIEKAKAVVKDNATNLVKGFVQPFQDLPYQKVILPAARQAEQLIQNPKQLVEGTPQSKEADKQKKTYDELKKAGKISPALDKTVKGFRSGGNDSSAEQLTKINDLVRAGKTDREIADFIKQKEVLREDEVIKGAGNAAQIASYFYGGTGLKAAYTEGGFAKVFNEVVKTGASGALGGGGTVVSRDPNASAEDIAKGAGVGGALGVVAAGGSALLGAATRKLAGRAPVVGENVAKTLPKTSGVANLDITIPRTQTIGQQVLNTEVPKEAGRLKRAFLSTSGQLSKLGEGGQELSTRLGAARDTAEISVGQWSEEIPTVMKLGKKDFTQFVDALGSASNNEVADVSPKVSQAIAEWNQLAPKIRQTALDAGLDVGDLGPNYFPKNYSQLLKDNKGLNRAAQQMVDSGQADNVGEALANLRYAQKTARAKPYGHLEYERTLDLPEYDKTKKALAEYLHFTGQRIGQAEQFGAKNEIANELLDRVASEGFDVGRADRNLRIALGDIEQNPTRESISRNIRKFNALRSLRTAAISNAGQSVNTATVSGYGNTIKAISKFLTPEGRAYVRQTGVVADSVLNDIKQQYGFDKGVIGKIASPLFKNVESFNRYISALAGDKWASQLAQKGDTQALRKLGVKGEIGKTLTLEQRVQASRKLVERTQFKIDAQDLPAWANSPEGKLVAQFRSFSYKQSKFINDEILKPLKEGDIKPLARFMAALPVGYGVYKGKNLVRSRVEGGKDQSKDDGWVETVKESYSALGAGGLTGDLNYTASQVGKPGFGAAIAGAAGGPTAGFTYDLVKNTADASGGKPQNLERQALKSVPLVGNTLNNRLVPYSKTVAEELPDKKLGTALTEVSKQTNYNPDPPAKKQRDKNLSNKEYDKYKETYYSIFQSNLSKVLSNEEFKSSSPETKKEVIQGIVRESGDEAREKLYGKEKKKSNSNSASRRILRQSSSASR